MTTIITTDISGNSDVVSLTSLGSLLLADGVTISATAGVGILGNGSQIRMTLYGIVVAASEGVELGDQNGVNNYITVGHNGSIMGAV